MNDIVRALAIAAGLLSPVILLMIIVSSITIKRGEASMHGAGHEAAPAPAPAGTAPASAKPAGKAPAVEEVNVGQILLYGVGLFTLTILALLGLSLIEHLN